MEQEQTPTQLEPFEMLQHGVSLILKSWSSLIMIRKDRIGQNEKKKIIELKDFFDTSLYKFSELTNEEITEIFILELSKFLDENEVSEYDVEDFLRVFLFEAFDTLIENEHDKEIDRMKYELIGLVRSLEKSDTLPYEKLVIDLQSKVAIIEEKLKKALDSTLVSNHIGEEGEEEDDEDDEDSEEEARRLREEEALKMEIEEMKKNEEADKNLKKKKKRRGRPQLEDLQEDDDEMPKPILISYDEKDKQGWIG